MFAFYELDSPAPYNICCLLIILFLLCLLFPALVYPPLCFSFLMVWSPVLHLLSTSMLFCMLVLIFFCLWDYTLVTDLSGAWKEGMCLDSQNEENIISKSRFPYADYWGGKSFKALFLNFPFCGLSWLLSIWEALSSSPLLTPLLLVCCEHGVQQCDTTSPGTCYHGCFLIPRQGTSWKEALASKARPQGQSCWNHWYSCEDGVWRSLFQRGPRKKI